MCKQVLWPKLTRSPLYYYRVELGVLAIVFVSGRTRQSAKSLLETLGKFTAGSETWVFYIFNYLVAQFCREESLTIFCLYVSQLYG